jgi:hypothetical protein
MRWRAAQLVTAMDGCTCESIVCALTALEIGCPPHKLGNPARWLTHFAGLESDESGKAMSAWISILYGEEPVRSTGSFREILASRDKVGCHG